MKINLQELNNVKNIDISFALQFVSAQHYTWMTAEKEHYKLLSFLSFKFNNSIIYDIGTYRGLSAIALAANKTNKVISYDIENFIETSIPDNVEFIIGNCYNDANILQSPLICLDVDPHDGVFEPKFITWLHENNYKGLLVLDDIHLNKSMEKCWNEITLEKYDVTEIGHYSGTGIVVF